MTFMFSRTDLNMNAILLNTVLEETVLANTILGKQSRLLLSTSIT